jgi:hypothetical protein
MTPCLRPIDRTETGAGIAEYLLILAPLAALVALAVIAIAMSGPS